MLFKLDENMPLAFQEVLSAKGHDVSSVYDQGLRGKIDPIVAEVCKEENRVLVTLDLDFADIREFPPDELAGVIVLRLKMQSPSQVTSAFDRVLEAMRTRSAAGSLWVVDESRIRVRRSDNPEP
jgi:predicted nuclease of predicted toxin-antitoxin system